jgi:hypothetical protein
MRTLKYRETIPNSALAEKKAIDLKFQNYSKISLALLSTSTNIRIKVKYVFEADGSASHVATAGAAQAVTSCTAANPAVYTSASHGYLVGDIVSVKGRRFQDGVIPDSSVASTFISDYEFEDKVITAVATNTFTIGEHSTSGADSFAGAGIATYRGKEADIDTIDLTSGTLTIVNFDYKLGFIRVTRDDTGSTPGGGVLRIDATAAK